VPCTPENNGQMKVWLLDKYASTTFIEINIDPTAPSNASHTLTAIPLQWQQRVYDNPLYDKVIGIIELVPYGEPGRGATA